jgi:hypothetical protein
VPLLFELALELEGGNGVLADPVLDDLGSVLVGIARPRFRLLLLRQPSRQAENPHGGMRVQLLDRRRKPAVGEQLGALAASGSEDYNLSIPARERVKRPGMHAATDADEELQVVEPQDK